jgi:hypothetical protein
MNIGRTWNRFTMTIMNAITNNMSLMKRGAPHGGGEFDDGTARADRYIGGRVNFFIVTPPHERRPPLLPLLSRLNVAGGKKEGLRGGKKGEEKKEEEEGGEEGKEEGRRRRRRREGRRRGMNKEYLNGTNVLSLNCCLMN